MSTVTPAADHAAGAPSRDSILDDLTSGGPASQVAHRSLHELLLRATRHQTWALRHLLPGAGATDIEDLAQQAAGDALMAVLRQLHTFQGRSRFTTWVYKFGILQAGVAVRRQAWRHREIRLPDTLTVVDTAPQPAAIAEATELAHAVQNAIATILTPHQRRVTLALLVEQVPIDVLADRLGTSRNALYKTLHDARQQLRAVLADSGHLPPRSHRSKP